MGRKLSGGSKAGKQVPRGRAAPQRSELLSKTHTSSVSLVGIYAPPSTNTPALANLTPPSEDAGDAVLDDHPKKENKALPKPMSWLPYLGHGQLGFFLRHTQVYNV